MIKRVIPSLAMLLAICLPSLAQEPAASGSVENARFTLSPVLPSDMVKGRAALQGAHSFHALNHSWHNEGPLTLDDGRGFSFPRAFGWVEASPYNFLPAFATAGIPRLIPVGAPDMTFDNRTPDVLSKSVYVSGEVSFLYGRSVGKGNSEVERGTIIGEAVDGNTHILVGGSYGHSRISVPHN